MSQVTESSTASSSERRRLERRSRLPRTRWPERRTGFDRRRDYAFTDMLRSNASLLLKLIVALNILNLLDLALTTVALSLGASEANPLMRTAFERGWLEAALFKVATMLAVTAGVWLFRRYRRVLQVAIVAAAVYVGLLAYHAMGLMLLV